MRHHPICWSRTLAKLGFRRRVRKAKPQWFRSMRMEPLETRQMLSTSQSPEVEFDDPIIIVSGPAAPTADSQLSSTSITDVYGTQGVVLPRQSYMLLSQQRADGSLSDQFVVRTEYDATGAPRAIVSLREGIAEIDNSLHTLQLELRIGTTKLGEIELLIDVESQAFRQQFLADRLERASQEVSPVEAAQLQSWMSALDAQGEFADLQGMEPEAAGQKSLERLNGVAKGVGREGVLPFTAQARLGVYTALKNSAKAAKTEKQAALTVEEKDAAAANARQVGRATLLLSDRIAADLKSTDTSVKGAAQALRNELLASGDLYYSLFTGLGRNHEVSRTVSGNAERVLAFVEEGSINLTPQLRIELGDQQAMVEGRVVQGIGFSSAALTATVSGDRYVSSGTETIDPNQLSVGTSSGNTKVSLMSVDLSSHQGKLPTQATLTLQALDSQPYVNHKISAYYQTWTNTTTQFNESTFSWSQYQAISSGFRDWTNNTWQVASGANAIDLTIAARRALLLGDSNVDGAINVAGAYGTALGDIEAFYQAVRHWDAYAAQYEDVQQVVADLLYRNDANWDGQVTVDDIGDFFSRLNTGRGNYTLDNATASTTTGADYSRWSQNYGRVATRFSQGDGNFDGWVNDADLTVWQGSTKGSHSAPTAPRLLLRIEQSQPNQTLVSYGSKDNSNASLRPVVDLTYGIAEASISSFIGTDTTTANGGMLRVQYRMPEGTPSGARSLSAYQVRQTPSGPVETLVASVSGLSGSPEEWSFNPTTITDPTSDYTIVARLSVGGVVVSERELAGGIFKDTDDNWHLLGGDGKDSVTINTDSMSITGDLTVNIKSASMPTARRNFYVRTGAGYDTVGFSPAWVQSAWFSGGDQNDTFMVTGPVQANTTLQIKDDSGLDKLDFSAAIGFQFNNFDLTSVASQDIVVNSSTAKLTLTLLDTPLEVITGVAASFLSGPGYNGAPLIVDTLADLPVGLGVPDDMGLRKALAVADAITGSNSIEFAPSLFTSVGQKKLPLQNIGGGTSTPDAILVASAVTINGPGAGALAISGENLTRIMQVNSGVAATVNDLTFLDGRLTGTNRGAGVLNNGTLTLNRVVFDSNESSNYGAAVSTSATGTLKVTDSTFIGNKTGGGWGGAIYSGSNLANALVIERSAFVGNEATNAGAIYLDGSDYELGNATIINSTFSGNKATNGTGGAIKNSSGAPLLTIRNSTIAYNSSTGVGGGIAMHHVEENQFILHNTIVAHNNSINTTDENIREELNPASSYNLIGVGGTGGLNNTQGNQINVADAGLLPLGDYGGLTRTHALVGDSAAVNKGDDAAAAGLATDQRGVGFPRIHNASVDVGAYEYSEIIWREAENYTELFAPIVNEPVSTPVLQVIGDLTASGSRLVSVFTNETSVGPSTPTTNYATYQFTVHETGTYYVWGRVKAPHANADSFYVKMDNGPWQAWDNIAHDTDWQWRQTRDAAGTLITFPISTIGSHTLYIATNEDATQLDKLLITDRPDLNPSGMGGEDPAMAALREVKVTAVVRDFHAWTGWTDPASGSGSEKHEDFEHHNSGLQFNLVGPKLVNGKPVFNSSGSPTSITNATSFSSWFVDNPTYNRPIDVTMHLLEDPKRPEVFQFVGSRSPNGGTSSTHEFYPIDGLGFSDPNLPDYEAMTSDGNESATNYKADEIEESHNYGFTTELKARFTYEPGQYLTIVQADDDMWVFINGQRVADLGGVHSARRLGPINIDSLNLKDDPNNPASGPLVPGKTYSFDLFYAERHTSSSHLVFETNIELRQGFEIVEDARLRTSDDDVTVNGAKTHFIVPEVPGALRIGFDNLTFDASSGNPIDVNDAFELAIFNTDGTSALPTIGPNSNAVFNVTQGQAPVWAAGVELLDANGVLVAGSGLGVTGGFVQIDISSLAPGTQIQLVARLVNNDADNLTSVGVAFDAAGSYQGRYLIESGLPRVPATPSNQVGDAASSIAFRRLADVTRDFSIEYQHTTFNERDAEQLDRMAARLKLAKKQGALQVRGDLLLAVTGAANQISKLFDGTQLINFDGRLPHAIAGLPAGTPFIRLTGLMSSTNGFYDAGSSIEQIELLFEHEGNERFDFELVVLGELNDSPRITSDPYSENRGAAYPVDIFPSASSSSPVPILEIVAGNSFDYTPSTSDPNGDSVTLEVINGPVATDASKTSVHWAPTSLDVGVHQIRLRAVDEHGLSDPSLDQVFQLRVVEPTFNRAPSFTTPPVTTATAGKTYVYPSHAFDPEDHNLNYSAALGGKPMRYEIPIGNIAEFVGQAFNRLTFMNDNAGAGVSMFSNIRLYEADWTGDPAKLKFDAGRFVEYGNGVDGDGQLEVVGDRGVVRITGDAALAYPLTSSYTVTAKTVLAFTFASEEEGTLHGIGLDNQTTAVNNGRWLKLYGGGTAGNDDYDGLYDPTWTQGTFAFDSISGLIVWDDVPSDVIGEWVHVDLAATESENDPFGTQLLSAVQPYQILVGADRNNNAPVIVTSSLPNYDLPYLERAPIVSDNFTVYPINPAASADIDALRTALLGSGAGISLATGVPNFVIDAQYNGAESSIGIFADGNELPTYGLSNYGIVLSTGNVGDYGTNGHSDPDTNNTEDSLFTETPANATYTLLESITSLTDLRATGTDTYTGSTVLEISVDIADPTATKITFDIVFGSEEWGRVFGSYVGSQWVDAFGIFLNPYGSYSVHDTRFDTPNDPNGLNASELFNQSSNVSAPAGYVPEDLPATLAPEQPVAEHPAYQVWDTILPGDPDYDPNNPSAVRPKKGIIGTEASPLRIPLTTNHPQVIGVEYLPEEVAGRVSHDPNLDGILWPVEKIGQDLVRAKDPVVRFTLSQANGLLPGLNRLVFVIADSGDSTLDTTVFISGLSTITADPYSEVIDAIDEDGDHLTFRITPDIEFEAANPDYMFAGAANISELSKFQARLDWDPPAPIDRNGDGEIDPDKYYVKVVADDNRGGIDEKIYTITVGLREALANVAPEIQEIGGVDVDVTPNPVLHVQEGRFVEITTQAFDADGDRLQYYLEGVPVDGTLPFDVDISIGTDGVIRWQVPEGSSGTQINSLKLKVVDASGEAAEALFSVLIGSLQANILPSIDSSPLLTILQGSLYRYDAKASDDDYDKLTWRKVQGPRDLTVTPEGHVVWDTSDAEARDYPVVIAVSDGFGEVLHDWTIALLERNIAPEIVPTPFLTALVGDQRPNVPNVQPWTYQVQASDKNGDTLIYELNLLTTLESGVPPTIDQDGLISWIPPYVGDFLMEVVVKDGRGESDSAFFTLPVRLDNAAPDLQFGEFTPIVLEEEWTLLITATDDYDLPSTDPASQLRFSIDEAAQQRGLVIDPKSGTLTWTPANTEAAQVLVTVTDSGNPSEPSESPLSRSFFLTLPVNVRTQPSEANEPARIDSKSGKTPAAGRTWTYLVNAIDLDGPKADIDVSIVSFVDANGNSLLGELVLDDAVPGNTNGDLLIQWTPSAAVAGPVRLVISAIDGNGAGDGETQTIDMQVESNVRPFITNAVSEADAALGQPESYRFDFIDFNSDEVRLEILSPAPGIGYFSTDSAGLVQTDRFLAASDDPSAPSTFYLQFNPDRVGPQEVTVRLTDAAGESTTHTIRLKVADPNNTPPDVSLSVPGTIFLGDSLDVFVGGDNPDANGDILSYYLLDHLGNRITEISSRTAGGGLVPTGLRIDSKTGRITWTPTAEQATSSATDRYTFTVQVTDGTFVVDLGPAELRVVEQPVSEKPPFIVGSLASARIPVNSAFSLPLQVIDFGRDASGTDLVSFSQSGVNASWNPVFSPASISNPSSPAATSLTFTPTAIGTFSVTITVTDLDGHTAEHTVQVEVFNPAVTNTIPGGSLRARDTAAVNELYVGQATGDDPDPNDVPKYYLLVNDSGTIDYVTEITTLSFGGGSVPEGLRIDPNTGRITWTPRPDQLLAASAAPYTYAVAVDDNNDPTDGFAKLGPVEVTVVSRLLNQPPTITSSTDDVRATTNGGLSYQAVGDDEENDPLTWVLVSGPGTIDRDTGRYAWDPAIHPIEQSTTAVIQVFDPYGPGAQQGIVIEINNTYIPGNVAPRFTSTPLPPGAGGETYRYLVRAKDDNGHSIKLLPPTVDNPFGVSTTFVDYGDGTGLFEWTSPDPGVARTFEFVAEDELGLKGRHKITLTTGSTGTTPFVDTPLTIDNEPPKVVAVGNVYFHQVLVTDPDGPPDSYSIVATRLDASGNDTGIHVPTLEAAISSGGLINWAPLAGEAGAIRVRIRATQNDVPAIQTYTLHVTSPATGNLPPLLEPAITLTAAPGEAFKFAVPGSDPQGEAIDFFLVDASDNLVREVADLRITTDGLFTWNVPVDAEVGTDRSFRVIAVDDSGQRSNQVAYTISVVADRPPSAGLSVTTRRPEAGQTVGLNVFASDDVGLRDVRLVVTRNANSSQTQVLVAGNNSAKFMIPDDAVVGETFTAVVTVIDQAGQSVSASVTLTVRAENLTSPRIEIESPDNGFVFETVTEVLGRIYDNDANLVYYRVTATPASGGPAIVLLEEEWDGVTYLSNLASGSTLATLSPFALPNGNYQLDVIARDDGGEETTQSLVFGIQSEAKLGNFGVSFTDLTVPVAGVPISIIRSYDTQKADVRGDFGYGWSMEILKGQFEFLAAGEENDFTDFLGFGTPLVGGSRIIITLPGGEEHGFTIVPVPVDQGDGWGVGGIQGQFGTYALALRPDKGQESALDFVPSADSRFVEHFNYPVTFDKLMPEHAYLDGFLSVRGTYNNETGEFFQQGGNYGVPITFNEIAGNLRLKTKDRTVYEFDIATRELIKVTVVNGNTLTIEEDGITAYNGVTEIASLKINRTNGLITSIEDPSGERITYAYDDGDLVTVTNRAANRKALDLGIPAVPTTTYHYSELAYSPDRTELPDHLLTSIDNALGVKAMKVGFDVDGRINRIIDASNQEGGFDYTLDLGDGRSVETVKDANQAPTEIVRDSRGNTVRTIQRTNTKGTSTPNDDVYLVSVFEYDDNDNQTAVYKPFTVDESVTGPNSRFDELPPASPLSTTIYDDNGRPKEVIDALNNKTTYKYDLNGNLEAITDAFNNTALNYYDADGRLYETHNAEGEITRLRYDLDGNLTEVIQVVDNVEILQSKLVYDIAGRLLQSTDRNGVSQYFTYDSLGNQTHAWSVWEDRNNPGTFVTTATKTTFDAEDRAVETSQYTLTNQNITAIDALEPALITPDWVTKVDYDELGRVVATTDRFGTRSFNLYDVRGNVVESRTQAPGANQWIVSRTAYDSNGRALATMDPIVVSNTRIPTDPLFDPEDDAELKPDGVTAFDVADYRATHAIYDDLGRVVESRRLEHLTGRITLERVGSSFQTVFGATYDDAPNWHVGFPNLLSRSFTEYNKEGRVFRTTSESGLQTYFEYDELGRTKAVVQVVDFDQDGIEAADANSDGIPDAGDDVVRTTTVYDAVGRQEIATDAKDIVTKYVYDRIGRITKTIADLDGLGVSSQTEYDEQGRRQAAIDPLGRRTEYVYDDSGRLKEVRLPAIVDDNAVDPLQTSTGSTTGVAVYQYGYDDYGNQTSITDPKNHVTEFTFDHRHRQIKRELPDGLVERTFYADAPHNSAGGVGNGQAAFTVDFEGNVTRYSYDNRVGSNGRLIEKRIYAVSDLSSVTINDATTASSLASALTAIAADRSVVYSYDALGRVTVVSDNAFSASTVNKYDVEGRLTQVSSPQGVVNYQYNDLGLLNRTWTTASASDTSNAIADTAYAYDELGRLKTVTVTQRHDSTVSEQTKYRYDANGNLDRVDLPGGVISDYVYDDLNRLDDLIHYLTDGSNEDLSNNTVLTKFDYTVGADGKRTREVVYEGVAETRRVDWVYDQLGRLTEERHDVAGGVAEDFVIRYGYDLASNRVLLEQDSGNAVGASFAADVSTSYSYDENDRLESETQDDDNNANDRHITYQYNGTTQTGKTEYDGLTPGSVDKITTYTYNSGGRLEKVEINEDGAGGVESTTTYQYNDDGIRVLQRVVDGSGDKTTVFHIDPNNHTGYAQVLEEGEEAGTPDGRLQTAEIDKTYALGHDVITQAASGGGAVYHFLYDGHGSTRALLNGASIVERYAYDAYGNMLEGAILAATTDLTRFLYSGEQTDKTGLQYLRARYYDPSSGRFNRLDPFAGNIQDPLSLHKYLYAHANPVMGIDPTGLMTLSGLSVGGGIAGALAGFTHGAIIGARDGALSAIHRGLIEATIGGVVGTGAGALIGAGGIGIAYLAKALGVLVAPKTAIFGLATLAGVGGIATGVNEVQNAEDPHERLAGMVTVLFSVLGTAVASNATYKSLPNSWIPWNTRTLYRGTTYFDALEAQQGQALNLSRIAANQVGATNDLGPGIYLTESRFTAIQFAVNHGGSGRGGGPAVLTIEITNGKWWLLKTFNGAVDRVPISDMEGHFQSFVPEAAGAKFNAYAVFILGGD